MPDKELIQKRISSFIDAFEKLSKYKNITSDDFKNNPDLLWILERGLYILIQNILDIFSHIVASDIKLNWNSYSDLANILYENDIINEYQKQLLIQMIGFRNRLAHEYLSLDKSVILQIVNSRLQELYEFVIVVKKYCDLI